MRDKTISEAMSQYEIDISDARARDVKLFCQSFETRSTHAQALNTPLLGVHPIYFTTDDETRFLNIWKLSFKQLRKTVALEMKNVNLEFKVSSNPFNLAIAYLLHKTAISTKINQRIKDELMTNLLKIMHYRFFTSLVNHYFKFKANEGVMKATIESLNQKYGIVRYETWKRVIEARCEDIISDKSIHKSVFEDFSDDEKVLYFIADTQTRIRAMVKKICSAFMEMKAKGDKISEYGLVDEIGGEKLILNTSGVYDTMISNLTNEVLNSRSFIDNEGIKGITSLYTSINASMLRDILINVSSKATDQKRKGTFDAVKKIDDGIHYIGIKALIEAIIQKSYRHCVQNKVNMRSKVAILTKIKNLYSSSRINDVEILSIKASVAFLIDGCGKYTREATKSSLRVAFILYIIYRSMNYMR